MSAAATARLLVPLRRGAVCGLTASRARAFSTVGIFKDKESAEENIYFRDQDAILTKKWAEKQKSEAEAKRKTMMDIQSLLGPDRKLPDDVMARLVDMVHRP